MRECWSWRFWGSSRGPLHYALRPASRNSPYARPVSDGSLYPAINRLERKGLTAPAAEPGPPRRPGTPSRSPRPRGTSCGDAARAAELYVTDQNRFFTLLAFLGQLADPAAQAAVLQRRLDFLDQPASFFYTGDRPQRAADQADRFRRGMLVMAGGISRAERAWLREAIAELREQAG